MRKLRNQLRVLLPLFMALILLFTVSGQALAATSQDIVVTYTPAYVAINITNPTWTVNGLTGDSLIRADTIYYSNPESDVTSPSATVTDSECRFTIGNEGSVLTDLTVNFPDFSGGTDPMINSDDGSNGAGTFGAYSYWSGVAIASKVVAKKEASTEAYDSLAASTSIKFGLWLETQSDVILGATSSTSTVVVSAAEHS